MQLANETGATSAQLLLRWALERGAAVIPTSHSVQHISDNLAARDVPLGATLPSGRERLRSALSLIGDDPKPRRWARFPQNDPFHREKLRCDEGSAFLNRHEREMATLRGGKRLLDGGAPHAAVRSLSVHEWPSSGLCAASATPEFAAVLGATLRRSSQPFLVLPSYRATGMRGLQDDLDVRSVQSGRNKSHAQLKMTNRTRSCGLNHDGHGDTRCHKCEAFNPTCAALKGDAFLQGI
eukprot:2119477-Prymnesium_polylepis.1